MVSRVYPGPVRSLVVVECQKQSRGQDSVHAAIFAGTHSVEVGDSAPNQYANGVHGGGRGVVVTRGRAVTGGFSVG